MMLLAAKDVLSSISLGLQVEYPLYEILETRGVGISDLFWMWGYLHIHNELS